MRNVICALIFVCVCQIQPAIAAVLFLFYICALFYVLVVRPFRKIKYLMQSPYSGSYAKWPMRALLDR